jgi:hypothetical protein
VSTLTPTLRSPSDLLNKLERERYRLLHARNRQYKADHLYNFCITSNALRDFIVDALAMDAATKTQFCQEVTGSVDGKACTEIGNLAKHAALKAGRVQRTRAVKPSTSGSVDVYVSTSGDEVELRPARYPDLTLILLDASTVQTYEFADNVIKFWHEQFKKRGLKFRRRATIDLYGQHLMCV